jgi:hypothetical protein
VGNDGSGILNEDPPVLVISTKGTSDEELYCCWLMVLAVLARGRGVLLGQQAIRSGASSVVMIAKFDKILRFI